MKKFLLSLLVVALAILPNYIAAKEGYGAAGCGLGAVVITENKKVHQVIAATVNGFLGNQTFGISTGTLNCKTASLAQKQKAQEIFVHMNYHYLEQEFAQGSGERVGALASLMGCRDSATFSKVGKEKFAVLFNQDTPDSFLQKMRQEVSSNQQLNTTCQL
ncbi:PF11220 family protein [Leptospira fainei serovar Hurstbridge str. BUT 6]|uniref:PF11220 family protein n=1 Tax=Leptospira fainei serovar Hurstbridge str. BUT 6 TaxID=1193011 RepID=S3V201_9LEPT|nr:DUF3015 family protein [Leptospira fainei]EPG74644.1 PF11220 family protein [Leptospira fainei serovar Hurstbridge str. BUT 6]